MKEADCSKLLAKSLIIEKANSLKIEKVNNSKAIELNSPGIKSKESSNYRLNQNSSDQSPIPNQSISSIEEEASQNSSSISIESTEMRPQMQYLSGITINNIGEESVEEEESSSVSSKER